MPLPDRTRGKISRTMRLRWIEKRRQRALAMLDEMERQGRPAGYINMIRVVIEAEVRTQIDEVNDDRASVPGRAE